MKTSTQALKELCQKRYKIRNKDENYVEIQGIKFKATGKVLTPDNEHVRQYLSDAKKRSHN